MANKTYIVSVGTSLITHYNDKKKDHNPIDIRDYDNPELGPGEDDDSCAQNLDKWLQCKANNTDRKKLSAELGTLLLEKPIPDAKDTILLLHTKTRSGQLCATRIKGILEEVCAGVCVCLISLDKIGKPNDLEFVTAGLPQLIHVLNTKIGEAKADGREVILVPTGGYKAFIPYFVIMGILHQIPCRYVYEESDCVLKLPALPLHIDLDVWSHIEGAIETLAGKDKAEADNSRIFKTLDDRYPGLLTKSDKKLEKSSVAGVFSARAEEQRGKSRLQYHTENSPLLDLLGDELRSKFLRLAAIGPHIWRGDRVPEMADHALLHHADLFAMAERVLLPLFLKEEEFLKPHELFALLCALHLHDCGHVMGGIELKDGVFHRFFVTEIREFHHVLGYLRLKEPCKHALAGVPIYEALSKPKDDTHFEGDSWGDSSNKIWEDYLRVPAILGLYHRKKMKLLNNSTLKDWNGGYRFVANSGLEVLPTFEENFLEPQRVAGQEISFNRALLLVCLLRVIDSLDEQQSRVGGEVALLFHERMLKTQWTAEEKRATRLKPVLQSVMSEKMDCLKKLNSLLDGRIENDKELDKTASAVRAWMSEEKGLTPEQREAAFEYAASRIAVQMLRFQPDPLRKKRHVKAVRISSNIVEQKLGLTVKLLHEPEQAEAKKELERARKSLEEEYQGPEKLDEKSVVCMTLADAGITFAYEVGSCPNK